MCRPGSLPLPLSRIQHMRSSLTFSLALLCLSTSSVAQDECFQGTISGTGFISDFGTAVDLTEDWVLVSDPGAVQLDMGLSFVTGNVGIYDKSDLSLIDTVWSPDFVDGQAFGASLAVHGEFVAIGAPAVEVLTYSGPVPAGSVHLYENVGGTLTSLGKLEADPPNLLDNFGASISLTDGYLAVGEPEFDRIYVYERVGSTFTLMQTLDAPGLTPFGDLVAISGEVLVTTSTNPGGTAHTYMYSTVGGVWTLVADLLDPTVQAMVLSNEEPRSLAFDGSKIAVGAPGGAPDGRGTVHVFRPISPAIALQQSVTSPTGNELFGSAVALNQRHMYVGDPGLLFQVEEAYKFVDSPFGWQETGSFSSSSSPVTNGAGYQVVGDLERVVLAGVRVYETSASLGFVGPGVPGAFGTPEVVLAPCTNYAGTLDFTIGPTIPNTLGLLVVGPNPFAFPFFGTTLYIAPPFALQLFHNADAAGFATFSFPWNEGVSGLGFVTQAFYFDPTVAPDNVSASDGVIVYGP